MKEALEKLTPSTFRSHMPKLCQEARGDTTAFLGLAMHSFTSPADLADLSKRMTKARVTFRLGVQIRRYQD